MAEFFAMGGYAEFVWPSYAASALGLAGLTLYVARRNARVRTELARLQEASGAARRGKSSGGDR